MEVNEQQEILKELQERMVGAKQSLLTQKHGSRLWAFDRGRVLEIRGLIMLVEAWNEPNRGKVRASV